MPSSDLVILIRVQVLLFLACCVLRLSGRRLGRSCSSLGRLLCLLLALLLTLLEFRLGHVLTCHFVKFQVGDFLGGGRRGACVGHGDDGLAIAGLLRWTFGSNQSFE